MAAPPPKGGAGGAGGAGGGAASPPPLLLPIPGPVGPAGLIGPASPPGPLGPPPAGAALLAQMVVAMQAAVAGLPAPGPGGPALPQPWVKISPLILKVFQVKDQRLTC